MLKSLIKSAALAAVLASGATAADVDVNTPEGAITAARKIQCSTIDDKPIYYHWEGWMLSRRMGEPDKRLFYVSGMNVRQCTTLDGGKKGKGYRHVSREILIYQDPRTREIVDTWDNPWTGETVDVLHVENDPVNSGGSFPYTEEGKPAARFYARQDGDRWFQTFPVPLFYHNVLQGDYQKQVGGVYHATEMFNFMGDMESIVDGDRDTADVQVGWVRQSTWLPWMNMQGREGIVYFHTAGQKVGGYDDLAPVLKKYIEERAPKYASPPPSDDPRENETSWTYYKKMVEGEKLPRGGHN